MKFLTKRKDGGPESTVTGYWLIEIKWLFSIVLLRFDGRSREAFHTHAFNCISWVLSGVLIEEFLGFPGKTKMHWAGTGLITRRTDFHKVSAGRKVAWVLSFRGPWSREWREYLPATSEHLTLTDGRKIVRREPETKTMHLAPLAKKVLKYLQRKGNASPLEVTLDLGVNSGSFTKRVSELRQAGYPITSETRVHPITGRRYKRYFYALHS